MPYRSLSSSHIGYPRPPHTHPLVPTGTDRQGKPDIYMPPPAIRADAAESGVALRSLTDDAPLE